MLAHILTCRYAAFGWLSNTCSHNNRNKSKFKDQDSYAQPERKTAIFSRFFKEHNLDIVALSETRFPGESQLEEVVGGYTFFWRERSEDEARQSGVGFAIKISIAKNLSSFPKGISDRIMTLRLCIGKDRWATFVSIYAPAMTNSEQNILVFYQHSDCGIWSPVLGQFGVA